MLQRVVTCLRVMSIPAVLIIKKHRMFVAKADVLHKNWDQWKGLASMCQITDQMYSTCGMLEKEAAKFLDRYEMMEMK